MNAYASSIARLNQLQSNASYIKNVHFTKPSNSLERTNHFLNALGITPDDVNRLRIIHVAGTKGKGSTCAFTESILRQNGYKTGFYSSPHLVVVRERIRINGKPLSEEKFSFYFDHVHKILETAKNEEFEMPGYFKFLTIMAFYVFLQENVDVAVLEVGIGGILDCTNVVQKPIITAVTSLDFDHCRLLGNTLADIASAKAGIFKPGVPALTVPQPEEAMQVLKKKAEQVGAPFYVAPEWSMYPDANQVSIGIKGEVQTLNASLAVQMVNMWLHKIRLNDYPIFNKRILDPMPLNQNKFDIGLNQTVWHGRCEIIRKGHVTYFLDAAHTVDSMKNCFKWFVEQSYNCSTPRENNEVIRILVFNCTGERNPEPLLERLSNPNFDMAIFTTNRLKNQKQLNEDQCNLTVNSTHENEICQSNKKIWLQLFPDSKACLVDCISECISQIENFSGTDVPQQNIHVLVCGSVHLVGGFIGLIQPSCVISDSYC